MTEYGITPEGFRRKPIEVIDEQIRARILATVSGSMLLEPTEALGAMHIGIIDALDQLWGEVEVSHNGLDPSKAIGQQVVSLAKTVGKIREGADRGLVTMSLFNVWPEGSRFEPGTLLVAVDGNSANSWTNKGVLVIGPREVIGGAVQADSVDSVFESTSPGSQAIAFANQITKIVSNVDGLISVNNLYDAEPGRDEQTIEELRLGFFKSRATGAGNLYAIESDVNKVKGVILATAKANSTGIAVGGIPPYSLRVTVWDGEIPEANDVAICQAIYLRLPPGTGTVGTYSYGFTETDGSITTVYFNRATQVRVNVSITVYGNVSADVITAAILATQPMPGHQINASSIIAAAIASGCRDTDTPSIWIDGSPSVQRLTPMSDQILLLDTSRITVLVVT